MNPTRQLDPVFPLSGGSQPRPPLRAPRLPALVAAPAVPVLGHHAFLRAWAGGRRRGTALGVATPEAVTPG